MIRIFGDFFVIKVKLMINIHKLFNFFIRKTFVFDGKEYQESGIYYNNLINNGLSDEKIEKLTEEIKELKKMLQR